MATYGTDLTTLNDAESTTWVELTNFAQGGGPALDGENWIQGLDCQSQTTGQKSGAVFSICYDNTTDLSGSLNTGDVIIMWQYFAVGQDLATYANGGMRMFIHSSLTAGDIYYTGGGDRTPYPYGAWQNVAVDPTRAGDVLDGGGNGGSYRYFGSGCNILVKITKGTPHAVDAIRYGRGEIYCTGTDANFTDMAAVNDDNSNPYNRWGLLQDTGGGTFLWKGLLSLGQSGTSTTFTDSNKTIIIDDAAKTYLDFNKIEIRHDDTTVDWTSISFTSLGTESPGAFDIIEPAASVTMDSCTFSDMNTFNLSTGTTITNTTFRACAQVVQSGATLDTCTFDALYSGSSLVTTHLSGITDCSFISGGSNNHAVELTDLGDGTMNWNNFLDGYIPFPSTGSTGNEAIYVSVGSGTLTINVGAGYDSPSIQTDGAVVTVLAGQVTTTVTVKDTDGAAIENARVYMIADTGGTLSQGTEIFNDLTNGSGVVTDIRSLASDQPVSGWVRKGSTAPYYKTSVYSATIDSANGLALNVIMVDDE
jgi:hypothetical protein